jgi:hypothetical protein
MREAAPSPAAHRASVLVAILWGPRRIGSAGEMMSSFSMQHGLDINEYD